MEFSWRYHDDLTNIFYNHRATGERVMLIHSSFDQNNTYSHSMVVDISKKDIEIPVIARANLENCIITKLGLNSHHKEEKIVFPLYCECSSQERRTGDSIIHQLFSNTSYAERIRKITTNKGETYYGGRGLIMDENFKPLLMCSMIGHIEEKGCGKVIAYDKVLIRVSPRVFIDNNKLLTKAIVKKMIPFYVSNSIDMTINGNYVQCYINEPPKVVVEDFDNFFITPNKPRISDCSQDSLNQVLIDNIEDVLALVVP